MKSVSADQIRARLLKLARASDRDFHGLSIEFAIERLIARLAQDATLFNHLVFKGGYVMLKAYDSQRATIDLDTSIRGASIQDVEARSIEVIEGVKEDGVWMGGIESQELEHQIKYPGRRLTIRFAFGSPKIEVRRLGKIILDIGVGDVITPSPVADELTPIFGGQPISWSIYPIETIISEKLHALVSHGAANSRAKDIYDLTVLLDKINDSAILRKAIKSTFMHRSTEVPFSFLDFWVALDKTMLKRAAGAVVLSSGKPVNFSDLDSALARLLKNL